MSVILASNYFYMRVSNKSGSPKKTLLVWENICTIATALVAVFEKTTDCDHWSRYQWYCDILSSVQHTTVAVLYATAFIVLNMPGKSTCMSEWACATYHHIWEYVHHVIHSGTGWNALAKCTCQSCQITDHVIVHHVIMGDSKCLVISPQTKEATLKIKNNFFGELVPDAN